MKNIFFSLISIAAFAVVFSACKKQEVSPYRGNSDNGSSAFRLAEDSCSCCGDGDTVIVGDVRTLGAIIGDPEGFAPRYFNFCTGDGSSTGAHIRLDHQFNSFITGEGGWNIDYLDSVNVPYATALSSIDCNDVKSNIQYISNPSPYENTMGANGSSFGTGWYNYNSGLRTITPTKVVLVWKDCDNNGVLSNGDIVFVVKINVTYTIVPLPPNPSSVVTPYISLEWKCIAVNCI